ncbi:MAG: SDR family oxidoreductase [Paracoccaceae bacterium]|jgi:NAD(P)-dependent dehydrogenase (short-subunit alcohol dehydrogenase family)|nr:SDR family oxidoreductase [Paracoccaceae bacterium]
MQLDGKRSLITGAGSDGIGRAVARSFADAGARVAIHHLDQSNEALKLAREIGKNGTAVPCFEGDFVNAKNARRVVRDATSALGGLDILVHCAATLKRTPFLQISDKEWSNIQAVNLHGAFAVGQEAARSMANAKNGGRIIYISSVNQDHPTINLAHYVASKGGVKMLARSMAIELAQLGITVNLVAPGTVETDLNRADLSDANFRRSKLEMIPIDRIADPAEIAGAALYLASPMAGYVTGTTITVDGGLTL